jgi:glycosyltransferase 2 family protein
VKGARGLPRLLAFGALFVALTVGGAVWALWRAPVRLADLGVLWEPRTVLVLGLLCAGIYLTDVLRYQALGAALATRVTWRAGLDASVANFFFSWITPGSTFGAPAAIYLLGRRGVPWDAAVVIAFAKAFTGVAVIVLLSLGFVACGLGPTYDATLVGVILFGGGVFTLLLGLGCLAAFRPVAAQRVVGGFFARFRRGASVAAVTSRSIDRLSQLRAGGWRPLAHLALTHLGYFAVFAAVGVVLLERFGCPPGVRAFAAVIVYIAFTYLAPTPGGAGFAEAMALPFFGPLLPPGKAVMFVLCFRGLTLYLQVGFGIPYMLISGGLGEMTRRTR